MGERCGCERCSDDVKSTTRSRYEEQWAAHDERAAAERRLNLAVVSDPLLRTMMPFAGKTLVDLGTGTGGFAFRAAELSPAAKIIGVDFSTTGLCVARATAAGKSFKDMDIEFVLGDLERLPLANKCADIILSQATFNLLPDKRRGMREMARIAKQGAKIAISDSFRPTRPHCGDDAPWEACIAGAMTVSDFSTLALASGMMISNQIDLTQQVKAMIKSGKWDWPEFVEHRMDYRAFVLHRA